VLIRRLRRRRLHWRPFACPDWGGPDHPDRGQALAGRRARWRLEVPEAVVRGGAWLMI